MKIKDRHRLNADESLSAPKTEITSPKKKVRYLFSFPAAVYQSSSGWLVMARLLWPDSGRNKNNKSREPKCPSRFARDIFRSWRTATFALGEGDIRVHLLYLCKQAWKSGFADTASPTGFDLQGPVQWAVIGYSRCCWVEPRAANSHVSSGPPPPPEHWARTAPGAPVMSYSAPDWTGSPSVFSFCRRGGKFCLVFFFFFLFFQFFRNH